MEPLVDDTSRRVWRGLFRVSSRLRARVHQELAPWDLTGAQFYVLRSLREADQATGLPLSELGTHLCVTRGNVTGLIDRLEDRGLVQRLSDEVDRRQTLAVLTPAGKALADEIVPHVQSCLTGVLANLTIAERTQLAGLVEKLLGCLESDPQEQ